MISTDGRLLNADPEVTVNDLLTSAELLNTPMLAGLYIYVLRHGPVTIEAVRADLELPHSTTYEYVGELEEVVTNSRPGFSSGESLETHLDVRDSGFRNTIASHTHQTRQWTSLGW